ncbi:MAG: hypothetical protein HC895_05600 [Leptolyngbyaceae cyanobacterium SM1_3_5]|nr:hypothetical protein [Leptolyngbyaceae cyanobacterium SM1_3_5]
MTSVTAPDLTADDYVVIGLATCFVKDEDGVHPVQVAEPIPSAALEAIVKGIPTSYESACATTIAAMLPNDQPQLPADFPPQTQFCDEFAFRTIAAARTYKSRPDAQAHIPAGTTRQDWNFSLDRKRVLNSERIVRAEDNVKQHSHTHKVL